MLSFLFSYKIMRHLMFYHMPFLPPHTCHESVVGPMVVVVGSMVVIVQR